MASESRLQQFLLALCVASSLTLAACGGSSDNVSPGTIVIPPDNSGGGDGDGTPGDGGGDGTGGNVVTSVIPSSLQDVITPSGETAKDGREIYDIDVSKLPGGKLNPDGLLLGNDVIFRILGGALRVSNG